MLWGKVKYPKNRQKGNFSHPQKTTKIKNNDLALSTFHGRYRAIFYSRFNFRIIFNNKSKNHPFHFFT